MNSDMSIFENMPAGERLSRAIESLEKAASVGKFSSASADGGDISALMEENAALKQKNAEASEKVGLLIKKIESVM